MPRVLVVGMVTHGGSILNAKFIPNQLPCSTCYITDSLDSAQHFQITAIVYHVFTPRVLCLRSPNHHLWLSYRLKIFSYPFSIMWKGCKQKYCRWSKCCQITLHGFSLLYHTRDSPDIDDRRLSKGRMSQRWRRRAEMTTTAGATSKVVINSSVRGNSSYYTKELLIFFFRS